MQIEARALELGLEIPEPPKPVAAYVPGVRVGNLVYTSGQVPFVKGELKYRGRIGQDLTLEQGNAAAQTCALNCLGVVKSLIGDLDKVERIVKITGFVASADHFTDQAKVMNGASELVAQIFGEKGKHARAALGTNVLPLNSACEVEMIVQVRD